MGSTIPWAGGSGLYKKASKAQAMSNPSDRVPSLVSASNFCSEFSGGL